MTRPAPIIAGIVAALLLLFGAYMGAYYVMLWFRMPVAPDSIIRHEVYDPAYRSNHAWVRTALQPANKLDRLIRPGYWGDE
jgi:hypothetical protein